MQLGLREQTEGLTALQGRDHRLEGVDFANVGPFLPRAVETALHDREVREDALVVECAKVAKRVRIGVEGGVEEVAQHEAQRFPVPDFLQTVGRQVAGPGAVLTRDIAEIDGRVGRLLRRDHAGEEINARVGHADRPDPDLAAVAHGHVEAGHGVEKRGLSGAGKSGESESHR